MRGLDLVDHYGKRLPVNQEFEQCLQCKKIVSFGRGKDLVNKGLSGRCVKLLAGAETEYSA